MEEYLIHDNGGRPFKVVIDGNDVTVFKKTGWDEETDDAIYGAEPLFRFEKVRRIFVGECDTYPQFLGNSVLIQLDATTYVFIGEEIKKFTWNTQIALYRSPVGNSDVPYPYAVDKEGAYLLMLEFVAIDDVPKRLRKDPYTYYYTGDNGFMRGRFEGLNLSEEEKERVQHVWKTKFFPHVDIANEILQKRL